jgi:amino acid transporter
VGSVVAAGVLGMVFLIALTVAITDIKKISLTEGSVAAIMRDQLGPVVAKILLVAVTFSFFAAGMVTMAIGARLVYAMARDVRFPFHRTFRRVNPRTHTPIPATILIFGGGVVLMVALPGNALLQLITAGTILPVIIYGATVVLYLAVRKRLAAKEGAFSLGRLELPVAIGALLWLVVALRVHVLPRSRASASKPQVRSAVELRSQCWSERGSRSRSGDGSRGQAAASTGPHAPVQDRDGSAA